VSRKKSAQEEKKPTHMISDCGKRVWELIRSVGKGGCGEVYLGKELNRPHELVAVKIIKDRKQFLSELNTMKLLHHHERGRGYTPKLLCALKKRKTIIMEYLGDTVAVKFEQAQYRFSLKTVLMLALNMVVDADVDVLDTRLQREN
jgi:serine/threonine protein kinase